MTIVIMGYAKDRSVIVGADKRITMGDEIVHTSLSKLIKYKSGMVVGYAGYGPVYESLIAMKPDETLSTNFKTTLEFTKSFWSIYDSYLDNSNIKKKGDASLLVKTVNNRLYYAERDCLIPVKGHYSIGSGFKFAAGYLCDRPITRQTVARALKVAAKYCVDCGPPYEVRQYR